MDGDRAPAILERLAAAGVRAWLDGGWGVDALLGRETRTHDDLDLLVPLEDVGTLEAALAAIGYAVVHGGPPASFELVDAAGHQVDVHPVRFGAGGEARYRMESGEDWVFPPGALSGRGEIRKRAVPCLTPECQLVCHATGYELDAAHRADVALLSERFGLAVPRYRGADDPD
ncbi:MAG: amino acid transporter [Thermoleophilia bacterium]|nr:amino acid transporter [Thermoleophilia bacterium]